MATSDPLMPLSESGKIPQVYQLDDPKNEARYAKDSEAVKVNTSPKFVGLTKEQLEEYRNSSFWRPMRIILFALFWLAWIGMFAGAVVIVVLSPKCAAKEKAAWYKSKISYQAWTPAFRDSDGDGVGDFKGMNEKLEKLRKIGVQTLWPTPVIQSEAFSYGVTDFKTVDVKLGTLNDFKELIDNAHDKDIKVVMDLPISTTSTKHPWFVESSKGEKEFIDYYIWEDRALGGGEKFWSKGDNSNKYYLHYEDKKNWPILNWENSNVKEKIVDAAKFWLDAGVDGFYVGFVDYLAREGATKPDWDKSTEHLSALASEIREYINATEALRDKEIALFSSLHDGEIEEKLLLVRGGLNYVINSELTRISAETCNNATIAPCLHKTLRDVLATHDDKSELHPMWEFGNPTVSRLATRVNDRETAELLVFIELLLPGALNFYYGEEIGMEDLKTTTTTNGNEAAQYKGAMQWDDTTNAGASSAQNMFVGVSDKEDYSRVNFDAQYSTEFSPVKMFKRLAKLRLRDETLMRGDFRVGALQGPDAFVFSHVQWKGNATIGNVYVGVVNFGDTDKTVDWSGDTLYSAGAKLDKAQVVATTSNVSKYKPRQNIDLSGKSHLIGPKQGIVFRFAS